MWRTAEMTAALIAAALLLIGALGLALPRCARAQPTPTGAIAGVFLDQATGQPVDWGFVLVAACRITTLLEQPACASVGTTGPGGSWSVTGLSPGAYVVSIEDAPFATTWFPESRDPASPPDDDSAVRWLGPWTADSIL